MTGNAIFICFVLLRRCAICTTDDLYLFSVQAARFAGDIDMTLGLGRHTQRIFISHITPATAVAPADAHSRGTAWSLHALPVDQDIQRRYLLSKNTHYAPFYIR